LYGSRVLVAAGFSRPAVERPPEGGRYG